MIDFILNISLLDWFIISISVFCVLLTIVIFGPIVKNTLKRKYGYEDDDLWR